MRVADDLRNRQDAAGFEGTMTLVQGSGTIRDFSEGQTEEHQVETGFGDVRLGTVSEDRLQIRDTGSIRSNLEALDHARLNVDPNHIAAWQDTLRSRDEQSAWTRANFQDSQDQILSCLPKA